MIGGAVGTTAFRHLLEEWRAAMPKDCTRMVFGCLKRFAGTSSKKIPPVTKGSKGG